MARPTVCAIFAGLLMFALAPQVRAGDGCSVADLNGDYSFVLSGTFVGVGPVAAAGETIYNGDGTAEGVIWVSLNGNQYSGDWTATYTAPSAHSPICSFAKTITVTTGGLMGQKLNFFITAGDDLKELRFVETDPGTAVTGTARKQ